MLTFPARLKKMREREDQEAEIERVLDMVYEKVWDSDRLDEPMAAANVASWWIRGWDCRWRPEEETVDETAVHVPFLFHADGMDKGGSVIKKLTGYAVALISDEVEAE
jgi:hypothetical protein